MLTKGEIQRDSGFEFFTIELQLTQAFRMGEGQTNMPIESECRTFYLMPLVLFSLSATVYEVFEIEICMHDFELDLQNGSGQM